MVLPFLGVLALLSLPLFLLRLPRCLPELRTELFPLDARGSILACVVAGATVEHSEHLASTAAVDCHFSYY